jgi:hypothetical protein
MQSLDSMNHPNQERDEKNLVLVASQKEQIKSQEECYSSKSSSKTTREEVA